VECGRREKTNDQPMVGPPIFTFPHLAISPSGGRDQPLVGGKVEEKIGGFVIFSCFLPIFSCFLLVVNERSELERERPSER